MVLDSLEIILIGQKRLDSGGIESQPEESGYFPEQSGDHYQYRKWKEISWELNLREVIVGASEWREGEKGGVLIGKLLQEASARGCGSGLRG